jgi:hypothetical protein
MRNSGARPIRLSGVSIVKRTTTWLTVLVAAATTATLAAAGPSFAATTKPTSITAYGPGGRYGYAYYNADTNILSIHDSSADGYGIAVPNWRSDVAGGPYYGWNRAGSGTTIYYQLRMPPLASIQFRVCAEQDGLIIPSGCGPWVIGYSGTQI